MEKWERQSVKDRIQNEFWISPTGRIRRWTGTLKEADNWVSLHAGIASIIKPNVEDGKATDLLYKLGWIAMGSACYGNRIDKPPTQAQINTLDKLGWNIIQEMDGTIHEW